MLEKIEEINAQLTLLVSVSMAVSPYAAEEIANAIKCLGDAHMLIRKQEMTDSFFAKPLV